MSKLDDILDSGLFTDSDGKPDYRTGKVRKQIKDLMLELIGEDSKFRKPEDDLDKGIQIGYDTLRAELREKVADL
jgi:hypothetical protein